MDIKDERGLPLTAASSAAVAAIDVFTARLSRIDRGAEAILEAAKIFPATPMIQLGAAVFCLFGQTAEADKAAKEYLDAAEPLLASANDRERRLHAAFLHWLRKDHLGAVAALEEITEAYPRDILSIKTAEFIYYILGQQHEGPRFLRHMERVAAANVGDPDFLAAHGFAHELCGHADEAERLAEEALARDDCVPWAHHCLAHVYLRRGEADAGVRRLESLLPLWMSAGRVIHCHNAWHLAVAYLERLGLDEAEALLHSHVSGVTPELVVEQLDAIALAWRIEMAGRRLDSLWPALAERVEPRIDDCYMPFITVHQIYALARAGREEAVPRCIARVRARGLADDAEAMRSWRRVGLAAVEASAAYGRGAAAECARLLGQVIEDVTVVGGSDAQVGLLRQTYLCSLIESGSKSEAAVYWRKETAGKALTELDRHWLRLAGA
jgi:tetratricopeptide (TPR) repeat protein